LVAGLALSLALFIITFIEVRPILPVILSGVFVPVIYIATMLLWGYNIIPWYRLAFGIGVALSISWTIFSQGRYAKLKNEMVVEGQLEK
jgi:hypothetical protein